jgi:hypothetical protein
MQARQQQGMDMSWAWLRAALDATILHRIVG